MQRIATLLTAAAAAVALASCSASGANPAAPTSVANISANVLQMNVGTANLFGDTPAAAIIGTNVAVTYRQPAGAGNPGDSAVLVSTLTLTLPHALAGPAGLKDAFNATIVTGPAAGEIGTTSLTATSQAPNASAITTFGNDGGAFGLGIEPFNYATPIGTAGVAGKPANVLPYQVPLYDAIDAGGGTDPNQFIPGGGPPAFNIAGNAAATQAGFNAISEGLDVFEIAPTVGTYALSVLVPANSGSITATATAAISTIAPLPAFVAPVPTLVAGGSANIPDGATFPVVLPAGVTEAYIQVTDYGPTTASATSCFPPPQTNPTLKAPLYYTIVVKASGTATLPLGSLCTAAQNTVATGTPSDGDAFTVQAIGFDYGAYEASYPNSSGVTSPSLAGAGASHQADVTVSSQGVYNQPLGGGALINGAGGAVLQHARR
jgi:hypothetical protein